MTTNTSERDLDIAEFKNIVDISAKAVTERIRSIEDEIVHMKDGAFAGRMMRSGQPVGFAAQASKAISEHLEQFDKHGTLRVEVKAATDLITTLQVGNTQNIGIGAPSGTSIGIQNALISHQMIGASSVEYSRYTGQQGLVGVQANEGDLKSALRGDWELINQPSVTLAGYTQLSRQALHSSDQLKAAINSLMATSLASSIDSLLWNGSAGLFAGLSTLATTYISPVSVLLPDAIAEAIATMQLVGANPTHVCISPSTWAAVITAKTSGSGEYLSGGYLGAPAPFIHGLPVILSNSVPYLEALLIDNTGVEIAVTQNPIIESSYVADGFIRNQATLLLDFQAAPIFKNVNAALIVVTAGETSV